MTLLANLLTFILPLVPEVSDVNPQNAELLFAGDAMMHEGQITAAKNGHGYSFDGYFDSIRPYVESADFAVVNFEASLGGKPHRGYPCFSAPDEYPRALVDAGFDFLLLANNHILDRRDKGLHRTIATLDSLHIPHAGVYHDASARDSLIANIVDVNGFKIGLLNYTYGTNGITIQGKAVVNYIDFDRIGSDVALMRQAGAELIAVCIHWGDEYRLLPNPSQKAMARKLIDMGVDMIIGSHPHVVQPMEMHTAAEGKPVLLVYSLGNFISNMKTDNTRGGAMVRVRLERDSAGTARVKSAAYSLVFTEPASNGKNYRLVRAHTSSHPKANVFRRNAIKIFDEHNINVPQDSTYLLF